MGTSRDSEIVYIDADFEDLVPEFIEDVRSDIESMTEALGSEDYETIRQLSHSIKGAGGSYGFAAISDIAKILEDAGKNRDSENIQKHMGELSD
jgi:HPt (histidine-containing phosphotransfer) domain-containing protein